jgi:NAD(P)H-dependent flavin oxidoreductase YrpB (nitropropane dioxygenase family)
MIRTAFTDLVGCKLPVQLAAMPNVVGSDLVVAVADAGGLAMYADPLEAPGSLAKALQQIESRTRGVVGVNFLMPFLNPECVDAVADKARVVEFFYADPDARLVERARRHGALCSWQVGSVEEACAAENAGCDMLVVQGTEAGGHVRGKSSMLPLLSLVLDAVSIPVLAAGGIATARDLAAVLAAGAAGARVGTRLLAARESNAHPDYVARLLRAGPEDTVLTEAFSAMWPHAPHRVLRSAVDAAQKLATPIAGHTPITGASFPIEKLSVVPPARDTTGHVEAMALYAGESVGAVNDVRPAAEILRDLVGGAERLLTTVTQRLA